MAVNVPILSQDEIAQCVSTLIHGGDKQKEEAAAKMIGSIAASLSDAAHSLHHIYSIMAQNCANK